MKLLVFLFILSTNSFSYNGQNPNENPVFNEERYFFAPDRITNSEVTKEDFLRVHKDVFNLYSNDNLKRKLEVNPIWESGYISAWATYDKDRDVYIANSWGGIARVHDMSIDTFSFIVCHEFGHLIGGQPYSKLEVNDWASSEGQADHFAASNCLKRYFANDDNVEIVKSLNIEAYASMMCAVKFIDNVEGEALCNRVVNAGEGFSKFLTYFNNLEQKLLFVNEDSLKVKETIYNSYPSLQCRLDTILNAALCSERDLSISHQVCKRLACWYKEKSI